MRYGRQAGRNFRFIQRDPLPLPDMARMGEEFREIADRALASYRQTSAILAAGVVDVVDTLVGVPDEALTILHHDLSNHYMQRNPSRPPRSGTSRVEAGILHDSWNSINAFMREEDGPPFRNLIIDINRSLTGSAHNIRSRCIELMPDALNIGIRMPPAACLEGQLLLIQRAARSWHDTNPVLSATVAMALLLNAHPFPDGNGRVSRLLFNAVLKAALGPGAWYLPLYDLAERARGGFQIRMRELEIKGDWLPLLDYVANAMVIMHTSLTKQGR